MSSLTTAGVRTTRRLALALGALALAAACGGPAADAPADAPAAAGTDAGADAPNNTAGGVENVSPSGSAPAAGRRPGDGRPTVLVAGTSLTAGLGLDPGDAYPALLQRKADSAGYGVRVVNAGLSGETSAGLARRIDWLLSQHRPDVVVVETGANDGLRGLDVDSLGANLRRIAAAVRAERPAAALVLVQMEAPPNFGAAYTRRFRETYATVAVETGATLAPFLLEGVAGVRALNQDDAIHPNPAGARRVATTVWRTLEPVLASLDPAGSTR